MMELLDVLVKAIVVIDFVIELILVILQDTATLPSKKRK